MPWHEKAADVPGEPTLSPTDILVSGPAWKAGIEDLARFRALSRKGGGTVHSIVQGTSMGAALPAGSRIRIRSGSSDSWKIGDVIAFLAGSRVVAHRIAARGRSRPAREFLIAQGDDNWLCDPPVHCSAVIGSVEIGTAEGEWLPVAASKAPWYKTWVADRSQAAMRGLLEANPPLAIRVSQVVSWMRMGPSIAFSAGRRFIRNVWN